MERIFVHETSDYKIEVLTEEERKDLNTNYALVNKRFDVDETYAAALPSAYLLIDELQNTLNENKPPHLKALN